MTGGRWPIRMSRRIPPPVAVTTARMQTPKMSIFFRIASTAPEMAKATAPMQSIIKMKVSIVIAVFYQIKPSLDRKRRS